MSISLKAQSTKKIEILNADYSYANMKTHSEYWRLIGNISFKHNNAIMYCDSAYHYTEINKMKAFGNIIINQGDSITITGKKLTYFGSKNQAKLEENVILLDNHMRLETDQITYNLISNIASYPYFGKIIDNEKIIHSKRGEYQSNTHNFIFTDSVIVFGKDYTIQTDNMRYNSNNETAYFFGPSNILSDNKTIYCEDGWYNTKDNISQFKNNAYITTKSYVLRGDSLYYDKNLGYGKAMMNVYIIDTVENMTITGELGEYFEQDEYVKISNRPVLEILFEADTLSMKADRFISKHKVGEKRILAYNNIKFFKTDLQGKCDSLSYNFSDSIVKMFKQPVLWSENFQITADSISMLMYKGTINHAFLKSKPMIISQEDSLDYNQIKGKSMMTYFKRNKIQSIDVNGNGQSIFIINDEKTKDKIGLNYTECSDLTLYFQNNKLNMVNYKVKPNSITTPYQEIKEKNRYLKGFTWRQEETPKEKKDILIE